MATGTEAAGPRAPARHRVPRSNPLDDRPRAEPPTAAHRDQPVAPTRPLQLVQRRRDQTRAGAAGRVAERDRAAVWVDALGIGLELLLPGDHHRREGLVDLEGVDLLDREAGLREHLARRGD